jgi:hypothetical protein
MKEGLGGPGSVFPHKAEDEGKSFGRREKFS